MADMRKRAEHLTALIDELAKFRDDALGENGVDLEADPPVVPQRFAASEYDGSESYMGFYDSVEEAEAGAAGSIDGEIPWAPYKLVDLDTGNEYHSRVSVKFKALKWAVDTSYEFMGTRRTETSRFHTRSQARGYVSMIDPSFHTVERGPYRCWEATA